jgi:cyclophilin family peptidyl-prolyl cis-trans isomerase
MGNDGPDTNGSQFMICLAEAVEWLDGQHAAARGVRPPRNCFWAPRNIRGREHTVYTDLPHKMFMGPR